jgi:SAM-dependent methyltransferase
MQRTRMASADCFIQWQSADALHTDRQFFSKIDFWRDILPGNLSEQLQDSGPGARAAVELAPGEQIPPVDTRALHTLRKQAVNSALGSRHRQEFHEGRFYPRGLLAGCAGLSNIFRQDLHPFRVSGVDDEFIKVDLNHPLAGYPLKVGARVDTLLGTREERGGHCNDIVADIAESGPGMQCRPGDMAVSYIHESAFNRADGRADAEFYQAPRLVHHIDSQARAFINRIYRRFIKPDMHVLDLMSSWVSHLDGVADSVKVTGLGMNAAELAANPQLDAYLLHDLNADPRLPFADASFDIVICSASVEYLVRPFEVFPEIGRVLKAGGHFIVTFSDRWFPPKVIQLWTELHPFERMGLILEYFRQCGLFSALATESCRGWARPADDKYYPQRLLADPVYAVWGKRTP